MGFARYARSRLWELVFLALASSALAFTICSAFYATQPLQQAPWVIAAACIASSIVLEAIAYSKTTAIAGGIALAVAAVVVVAVCAVSSPYELPLEDAEGNYTYFALIVSLTTVAAFLLSRTKPGSVVLLIAGAYVCGLIEYLYWYGHILPAYLFLTGAVGLIVCAGYRRSLYDAEEGSVAFTPVALAALGIAAAAVFVGAGVYFAVIAPLNPPSQQVKLFIEDKRVDEIYIMGTGSSEDTENTEGGSLAGSDEEVAGEAANEQLFDTFQSGLSRLLGMDENQEGDEGTTSTLQRAVYLALIIAGLIVLIIVAAILLKKLLRKRRYNHMLAGDNDQSAVNLYLFFLNRMEKLKMRRPDNMGLTEYVRDRALAFSAFEGTTGADGVPAFSKLTDVYVRTAYGSGDVSDGELDEFKDYYRTFYKNAQRKTGRLRYLFKYFFL